MRWHEIMETVGSALKLPSLEELRQKPTSFPEHLAGAALAHYMCATDDIDYSEATEDCVDWDFIESVYKTFANATATLRLIPIARLKFNSGYVDPEALDYYRELPTRYPPIVVVGRFILEGNHRVTLAKERGETEIWAYVVTGANFEEPLHENGGRIVKGVNTTCDVGVDEITRQAAKFGNKVSRDGVPAYRLR